MQSTNKGFLVSFFSSFQDTRSSFFDKAYDPASSFQVLEGTHTRTPGKSHDDQVKGREALNKEAIKDDRDDPFSH